LQKSDLSLKEVCERLGKSRRTVSRYISNGLLNPDKIKTERGLYEYRFDQSEIESLKKRGRSQTTGQNIKIDRNIDDTLALLKDTIKLLQKQLKAKDNQINKMLERQREANILTGQLQNKVFLLEDKSKGKKGQDTPDKTGQDIRQDIRQDTGQRIRGFFKRIFKGN